MLKYPESVANATKCATVLYDPTEPDAPPSNDLRWWRLWSFRGPGFRAGPGNLAGDPPGSTTSGSLWCCSRSIKSEPDAVTCRAPGGGRRHQGHRVHRRHRQPRIWVLPAGTGTAGRVQHFRR